MGNGIHKNLNYLLKCILDIIFPPLITCSICKRVLKDDGRFYLCSGCMSQIEMLKNNIKNRGEFINDNPKHMEDMLGGFDFSISVCSYYGKGKDMVQALKYKDNRNLALSMAAMIKDVLEKNNIAFNLIVPVPIHKKRLRERGYNQAELIAIELSNLMGVDFINGLYRMKDTPSQVLFNGSDRWYNVKDVFKCCTDLDGKSVLLLDDVLTTGATASFCAKALKNSGAENVIAASFARTI